MGRNKVFNVHDLYPADYCFDYEAFEANPEGYVFTPDDIAYSNAMELERYEREVPMSYYEKTLLRKWVMSGHSPRQNPGSRYLCPGSHDDYDFLTLYRMDKEIQRDMKGMSKEEQKAYLMEYMGWRDDEPPTKGPDFVEPQDDDCVFPFDL
jgi:hypothetical protein